MDREAADREHKMEREQDDIAKIARENDIVVVDAELKLMWKTLAATRSEVVVLNKEMALAKKNKTASKLEWEAEKAEIDILIRKYDEEVRGLRERLRHLQAANVVINKATSLKRKNLISRRKKSEINFSRPPYVPKSMRWSLIPILIKLISLWICLLTTY